MTDLITIAAAAEKLGIGPTAVRKLIARGLIVHYRPMPRVIRLRASDVDAYLESTLRQGRGDDPGLELSEVRMPRAGGWGR
ncbi:unnamed protein product [uncultured bacterium]|nr:unnamed protein product [uncultured bacterium]